MATNKTGSLNERRAVVERLREFIRFGYVTGAEVARRIGLHDGTVYSSIQGEFLPGNPKRLIAFLVSLPAERASGIAPTGYQYREYKNWRGIPKSRSRGCSFCKQAAGEIRKVWGGVQGVCPNCGATGPMRDNFDEALRAWNGKR